MRSAEGTSPGPLWSQPPKPTSPFGGWSNWATSLGISTLPDRRGCSLYGIGGLPDSGELIMTVGLCLRRQDKCFMQRR